MAKRRIELIDLIKAFTIFCVIWGHCAGNADTPFYRLVLYTFHMPLFFFLAGVSMKQKVLHTKEEWLHFLKRNVLALIVPYLIWGAIYCQSVYSDYPKLLYASWEALTDIQTLTSLWFLPCLFVARLLIQIIMNVIETYVKTRKELAYGIAAVVCFIVGVLLPHGTYGWFMCSDIAFVAVAFILAGLLLRKQVLIMAQQKARWLFLTFAVSVVLFVIGTYGRADQMILEVMCQAVYGNIFWFLYNSIFGSLIVITFSMLLARVAREGAHPFSVNYITFVGMHTMGIYLLHKPILQTLVYPMVTKLFPASVPDFIPSCICAMIMIPITCVLCMVVERFIPELLGKFPREA